MVEVVASYFLAELTSLDDLSFPATATKRIKLTCVCASTRLLVLGTSSGTGYIFPRFRPKGQRTSHMAPVDVFLTKDGPVNKMCMNGEENALATGSDSGRVTVLSLTGDAAHPVYTVPGDARRPDKVTAMMWSADGKSLYVGHASGLVNLHNISSRSVLRGSVEELCNLKAEICQLDGTPGKLLVSSTGASFVVELETKITYQIGKKPRNGHQGACFVRSGAESDHNEFVVAARHNGRLWEANTMGVVYRTHQLREMPAPRTFPITFRNFLKKPEIIDRNLDVHLSYLHLLYIDGQAVVLSWTGCRILLFDMENSQISLLCDLSNEILDLSVCGSDIFVLLTGPSAMIRKYSILTRRKVIDRVLGRSLFAQAAQFILYTSTVEAWPDEVIRNTITSLEATKKKENQQLAADLNELIVSRSKSIVAEESSQHCAQDKAVSKRLESGIHLLLPQIKSLIEDDFSFKLPRALRERSHSSPSIENKGLVASCSLTKRASVPLSRPESRSRTFATPELLKSAREILDSTIGIPERESLRTLLQLEDEPNNEIQFQSTITVNNAAKALAELALAEPVDVTQVLADADKRVAPMKKTSRLGPTIVKVITPGHRNVVKTQSPVVKRREVPLIKETELIMTVDSPVLTVETNSNISSLPRLPKSVDAECWSDEENNSLSNEWIEKRIAAIVSPNEKEGDGLGKTEGEMSTNGINGPSTSETEGNARNSCPHCGLHITWTCLVLVALVCRRVNILENHFSHDGVPYTSDEWFELLREKLSTGSEELRRFCVECQPLAADVDSVIESGVKSIVLPSPSRGFAEKIRERVAAADERLRVALFGHVKEDEDSTGSASAPLAFPNERLSKKHSVEEVRSFRRKSTDAHVDGPFVTKPHPALAFTMRQLLSLACVVLGVSEVLLILKRSGPLVEALSDEDWACLAAMTAREQAMRKDLVDFKVVADSLGTLSHFVAAAERPPPSPRRRSLLTRTSPPIHSWTLDTQGSCPMCALPLKTVVAGSDLNVMAYSCGHAYHSTCVAGRIGCVACRVRARRAAAKVTAAQ